MAICMLIRLYALVLRLYPPHFRAEFAEEMLDVFATAVAEAGNRGGRPLLRLAFRELADLPAAAFRMHLNEHRSTCMESLVSPQARERISWVETLAGLWPFVLFGPITILSSYPHPPPAWRASAQWQAFMLAVYLSSLLLGVVIGRHKHFPRWSYPYIGGVLVVLGAAVSSAMQFTQRLYPAWLQVFALFALIVLAGGLVLLVARCWDPLRALYLQSQRDWTQAIFGLFVFAALLFALIDHDEDPTLTLPVLLPAVIVLLGALAYLRSRTTLQRSLALCSSWTLATAAKLLEGKAYFLPVSVSVGAMLLIPLFLAAVPRFRRAHSP